ncbi:hypothetical protein [Calothrix sp. NIES-2100]
MLGLWESAIALVILGKCDRLLVVLRNAIAFIVDGMKCDRV